MCRNEDIHQRQTARLPGSNGSGHTKSSSGCPRRLTKYISEARKLLRIDGNARMQHPAPNSPEQDHTPMPLSSQYPTFLSNAGAHATWAGPSKPSCANLTKNRAFAQHATHIGSNPSSTPHSQSVDTSAPYHAPCAPAPMGLETANTHLPAPSNLVTQRTMLPRFREAINFRTYFLDNQNQTISSRQMLRVSQTSNELKLML